jgi:hypothetical protein
MLDNEKASCFLAIHCGTSLKFMRSFEDKLVLVFRKGIFEIANAVQAESL